MSKREITNYRNLILGINNLTFVVLIFIFFIVGLCSVELATCSTDSKPTSAPTSTTTITTTTTTSSTSTTSEPTTTTTTIVIDSSADDNVIMVSADVFEFLAGVIFFEQGDYCKEGQIAVGHVILNRIGNDLTEEKLMKVITGGAFASVSRNPHNWEGDGIFPDILQSISYNGNTYYTKKPTEQSLEVTALLLSGLTVNPIGSRESFREESYYLLYQEEYFANISDPILIGDNIFFTDK